MPYLKYIIALVIIIIVVVCLYYLYGALKVTGQKISKHADLNVSNTTPITFVDKATNFSYSVWIYVNSYNTASLTAGQKNSLGNKYYTIFCRSSASSSPSPDDLTNKNCTFLLELDSTVPTLSLHLLDKDLKSYAIVITDNMPIQKWTCVTLCVSNQYVDSYINGQLVQSNILKNSDSKNIVLKEPIAADKDTPAGIYVGGQGAGNNGDIFLGNLMYWNYQLSPKEVSNYYLSGNPAKSSSNPFSISNYGAQMVLLKNNIQNGVVTIM